MGAFYILAGLMHFVSPAAYLPLMPPWVPATRRLAAWGLIVLLIAIFPANLHVALHNVPLFGATEGLGVWNWVRLPFQLVLILWAWWYT